MRIKDIRVCFRKTKELSPGRNLSKPLFFLTLALGINFDVGLDFEGVKNIFGRKHSVFAFVTICLNQLL